MIHLQKYDTYSAKYLYVEEKHIEDYSHIWFEKI